MGIRLDCVWTLVSIDLSTVNPALANRMREKKAAFYDAHPEQLTRDIINKQHVRSIVLMLMIYAFFFFSMPFAQLPVVFDSMYAVLMVLTIMQSVSIFFALFYDDNATYYLMSLPVRPQEVFAARTVVASTSVASMAVTLLPLFFFFFWDNGVLLPLSILWSLFFGLLSFWLVLGGNFIVMQFLLQLQKGKKMRPGALSLVSTLISMASIIVMLIVSARSQSAAQALAENHVVEAGPISGLLLDPMHRMMSAAVLLTVSLLLFLWVYRRVMLRYYDYIYSLQGSSAASLTDSGTKKESTVPKNSSRKSLRKALWRYNRQLINDQTIPGNIISSSVLPLVILFPILLNGGLDDIRHLASDPALASLMLFTSGMSMAILINVWFHVLSSMMLSLDGANLSYILSLPLSMRRYLREKWLFSAFVSAILPILLLSALALYTGLWQFLPFAIVSFTVTHLIFSRAWLLYDIKNLNISWKHITDLYLRVNKGGGMALAFVGFLVAGGLLSAAYYLSDSLGVTMVFAFIGGIWLMASLVSAAFINRRITSNMKKRGFL